MKYKTEVIKIDAAITYMDVWRMARFERDNDYKMLLFTNYRSENDNLFSPWVSKDGDTWYIAESAWIGDKKLDLKAMTEDVTEKYENLLADFRDKATLRGKTIWEE